MLTIDEICDRLDGPFEAARDQLPLFNSVDRSIAIVLVLGKSRTPSDALSVYLDWGNLCGGPWWQRSRIAEVLRWACSQTAMPELLPADARSFYDSLPELVTVWRGCEKDRERGQHWTRDRAVAEGFAIGKRVANSVPTLVTAQIPKQHIFAVFVSRNEHEIVLDPRRLRNFKIVPPNA